ncbi:MAG: GNAT family N-acetyltransferase [Bosea sp. (in: a-proteobacteria)]
MAAHAGFSGFALETQTHFLLTPNLILRPPRRADFHAWATLRHANRAFLSEYEILWKEEELNRYNFQLRLRHIREQMTRGDGYSFLVLRREDARLMGGIVLYNIRRGELETCTAGAWMGRQYAMSGHMKEAMRALVPYAFNTLGLSRMEADSQAGNERAIRVLEAVGFQREGIARRQRWQNGEWRDHVLLARLSPEREAAGHTPPLAVSESLAQVPPQNAPAQAEIKTKPRQKKRKSTQALRA